MEAAADRGQDVVASNDPLGGQDQAGAVVLEPVVPTVQFELAVFAVIIGVAVAFQYLLKRWQRESPRSFHLGTLTPLPRRLSTYLHDFPYILVSLTQNTKIICKVGIKYIFSCSNFMPFGRVKFQHRSADDGLK
uniref:Uncharacterized protein n=1 Tax=Spongospora subterranea TaxID=70186 RepID=A0A0H5QLY8_9EUKA|eukprot:CRZ02607.1 hypothetical protein [Spongospora subterranea]